MKMILVFILFLPVFCFSQENAKKFGIDTTDSLPSGISIGATAPKISATSIYGNAISSDSLLAEKQIVVLFYRGEWCPVCNRYLSNLTDSVQYITEKNAAVLVVGPELIKNAEKTAKKTKAEFIIISDTSYTIQKDFDVLFHVTKGYQKKIKTFLMTDIAKNNGKQDAYLPIPATYIINQKGIIIYKDFHFDYHIRASVKEIIDNLTP